MKKTSQILLILLLILSCNSQNKTQPKSNKEDNWEMENYQNEERIKKRKFLKKNVFIGLENLNDGFDSRSIYYFSESDFEVVLNRVEEYGIGIMGIEPWLNGDYYGVMVVEDFNTNTKDPKWYRKAFSEFKKSGKNLMYAASYDVPIELINK